MGAILRYEHDADADALYVHLADKPYAYGEDLSPERRVDFAADRTPVGVELTCLSHGVSLAGLPASAEIGEILTKLNIKMLV
jgi:Protein of unknown function (DUF2283)